MFKCFDSEPFSPTYGEEFGCIGPRKQNKYMLPYEKEAFNPKKGGLNVYL